MFLSSTVFLSLWLATLPTIYLTSRFHVPVRLFSNGSQMTLKRGKNKKVAHEAIAECVTDVLTTFWRPLLLNRRTATWNLFVLCNKKTYKFSFLFQNLLNYSKAGLYPLWQTRKTAIWPQVSMVYRLINHAGCWKNARRIWFTNSSSVLPTYQVVYRPINHKNLWSIAFI